MQLLSSDTRRFSDSRGDDTASHIQLDALMLGSNLAAREVCGRQQILCT